MAFFFDIIEGQQSEPAYANNTTEFSPTNRLKHLWIKAQGKSKEVINQHTFLVSHSVELVGKGNSHQPKPCK